MRSNRSRTLALLLMLFYCSWGFAVEELIINGEFDDGLNGWGRSAGPGYTMEVVQEEGFSGPNAMKIDIIDATAQDYVMVSQGDLSFVQGETYPISFIAKAERKRKMRVILQQVNTWIDLWEAWIELTPEPKTYSFEFTHTRPDMDEVAFYFALRNPWFPVPGENENIDVTIDRVFIGTPAPRAYPNRAYEPTPGNNARGVTFSLLQWKSGDTADAHNVYVGTTPSLDQPSDYKGQVNVNRYFLTGTTQGQTYYWRIDEVEADGTTIHEGAVWRFTMASKAATLPQPADGALWIGLDTNLSWDAGLGAVQHEVYFDTDETAVAAGSEGSLRTRTTDAEAVMDANFPVLEEETTYYWRVDEIDSGGKKVAGAVWSFTTIGPGDGIAASYYNNMDLAGDPVLTRVDKGIDFHWGGGSPDPSVNADQFSARWEGDLLVAFSELYTLYTSSDDGARIWLNGELILDFWVNQGVTEHASEVVSLTAGKRYPIAIEYYEDGGGADMSVLWSSPSTPKQLIPVPALDLPRTARAPQPADQAVDVAQQLVLNWTAGVGAVNHDVYFGTDRAAVTAATPDTADIYQGRQRDVGLAVGPLDWGQSYYWRVDEIPSGQSDSPYPGQVWCFTTADFLIVDDFEDYNDGSFTIFDAWWDGYNDPDLGIVGNGSNAVVGYLDPPFAEQNVVHTGKQAMPLFYYNATAPYYSDVIRTFDPPQDWTQFDVKTLGLTYQGQPAMRGFFTYDAGTSSYTVTGYGWDVIDLDDQCHYVYTTLGKQGSITAQVTGLEDTDDWAKAGVMIRDSFDGDATMAFAYVTPSGRVGFRNRPNSEEAARLNDSEPNTVTLPYWVRLTRNDGHLIGEHSADGVNWSNVFDIEGFVFSDLSGEAYVGLAVVSRASLDTLCEARFANVEISGQSSPLTSSTDVGLAFNVPDSLAVVVEDSAGKQALIQHPDDPDAVVADTWKLWPVSLDTVADQGVDLTQVKSLSVRVGEKSATQATGDGVLYIDDIRLYPQDVNEL